MTKHAWPRVPSPDDTIVITYLDSPDQSAVIAAPPTSRHLHLFLFRFVLAPCCRPRRCTGVRHGAGCCSRSSSLHLVMLDVVVGV